MLLLVLMLWTYIIMISSAISHKLYQDRSCLYRMLVK